MRTARIPGVSGIGNVFAALHHVTNAHADRVPVEMRVDRVGAVVVQNAHDVRQRHVRSIGAALEIPGCNVENDATACSEYIRANRHRDIDRILRIRCIVGDDIRVRLADRVIARDCEWHPVWLRGPVLRLRVAYQVLVAILQRGLNRTIQAPEINERHRTPGRQQPAQRIIRVRKLEPADRFEPQCQFDRCKILVGRDEPDRVAVSFIVDTDPGLRRCRRQAADFRNRLAVVRGTI